MTFRLVVSFKRIFLNIIAGFLLNVVAWRTQQSFKYFIFLIWSNCWENRRENLAHFSQIITFLWAWCTFPVQTPTSIKTGVVYFQGRRFRQKLYVCRRKGWILQPYSSLDVQNLQVYPLWSRDYQGATSRKGRESRARVYISASKMAQKRRRRKHSSPASYGGLCYQNEAWWAQ